MKNKETVGLYIIAKDEVESVEKLARQAMHYFDAIYITVTDKKAYKKLAKLENLVSAFIDGSKPRTKFHIDQREWNDRFDDARNHNFAQGDTDRAFWIDADDEFDFSVIPELMKLDVDAVWLPYEYAHDEDGNCIALHWRERLVRKDKFTWKGWVHENLITDDPITSERVNAPIRHTSTKQKESMERNHKILEKAYKETKDPRYIHYLGISYYSLERWQLCIDVLQEYIQVGGWDEEIYRSLLRMSEAANNLGNQEEAIQYSLRAMGLLPEYPQAYFNLAQFEFEADNFKQCLEWLKVGFAKPQPETSSIVDPTVSDRAKLMGAIAEHKLGNNAQAAQITEQVTAFDTHGLLEEFQRETSIDRASAILPALYKHYEDPSVLWNRLKEELKYDNRFRKVREALTEPKVWPENSIVFFCGRNYEEWGPHTLDKGMGGSEEAIVYLSEQLARLGYDVTVYGEIKKPLFAPEFAMAYNSSFEPVKWLPWTHIDKRDTFDTLIIWRFPQLASQFKAKKKFIDMHDLMPEKVLKPYKDATYLFKSQAQASKYPNVTNYHVISNGLELSHFEEEVKRDQYKVIYPSAYYRGLECLVDMWPKIKEQVPEASLDIFYGWQSWVSAEGEDDFYHRMNQKLKEAEKLDVRERGRVSHEDLAKSMLHANVWAYPTQFEETNCITALKANAAGLKPVITDVAALVETGGPEATYIESARIYSDQYAQKKFIKAVVDALKNPSHNMKKQKDWVKNYSWAEIAKQWKEAIK